MQAIKDYENNKWKVIGQKVGKPAKVRESVFLSVYLRRVIIWTWLWPQSHHASVQASPLNAIYFRLFAWTSSTARFGSQARSSPLSARSLSPSNTASASLLATSASRLRPSPTRPTPRTSSYASTRLRDTGYLDHALPASCILNLTALAWRSPQVTLSSPLEQQARWAPTENCVPKHT